MDKHKRQRSLGRMIRQSISRSKGFASLSPDAQRLFVMLIPHFNSYGKMNGSPHFIKGEVVPLLTDFTIPKIDACLKEINDRTSVRYYTVMGLPYLQSVNFERHQDIRDDRRGDDHLPNFPYLQRSKRIYKSTKSTPGVVLEDSRNTPGSIQDDSGRTPGGLPHEVEVEVEVEGELKKIASAKIAADHSSHPKSSYETTLKSTLVITKEDFNGESKKQVEQESTASPVPETTPAAPGPRAVAVSTPPRYPDTQTSEKGPSRSFGAILDKLSSSNPSLRTRWNDLWAMYWRRRNSHSELFDSKNKKHARRMKGLADIWVEADNPAAAFAVAELWFTQEGPWSWTAHNNGWEPFMLPVAGVLTSMFTHESFEKTQRKWELQLAGLPANAARAPVPPGEKKLLSAADVLAQTMGRLDPEPAPMGKTQGEVNS